MEHRNALLSLIIILIILLSMMLIITFNYEGKRLERNSSPVNTETSSSMDKGSNGLGIAKKFSTREELLEFISNQLASSVEAYPKSLIQPAVAYTGLDAPERHSQTNIQVKGVDEPDVVKTDGRIIAYGLGHTIYLVDSFTDSVKSLIKLNLSYRVEGLFLQDDKLIVLAVRAPWYIRDEYGIVTYTGAVDYEGIVTNIIIYDVSDPINPVMKYELSVSGSYFGSRLVDKYLYVLTREDIYYPHIPLINGKEMTVDRISLMSLRPTSYLIITSIDVQGFNYSYLGFLVDHASLLYVSMSRIYVGKIIWGSPLEPEIMLELAKNVDEKARLEIVELISNGKVYEAYQRVINALEAFSSGADSSGIRVFTYSDRTIFYVFTYSGLNISFKLGFEVEGTVLDQFAMEELNQSFVVATTSRRFMFAIYRLTSPRYVITSGEKTFVDNLKSYPSVAMELNVDDRTRNNVYIIDLNSGAVIGKLEDLAPGERIYSARLVKNILFLVTYRFVDPLFAIDLSNVTNPSVLGFLKIPGFSEYLHPINENLLLGIGLQDRFDLLKITLFNVTDPTKLSEIQSIIVDGWSPALNDHHAVTIDIDYGRLYIPVLSSSVSGVLVIKVAPSEENKLTIEGFLEHDKALRTVYVGKKIYVIGENVLKVFDIYTLEQVGTIVLPVER